MPRTIMKSISIRKEGCSLKGLSVKKFLINNITAPMPNIPVDTKNIICFFVYGLMMFLFSIVYVIKYYARVLSKIIDRT